MLFPHLQCGSLSGHIGGDYAHMAHTALVPTFAEHGNSESDSVASTTGYVDVSAAGETSLGVERDSKPSGVENFRRRAAATGISENAAALVVGAWRGGTQTAYNSSWTKWVGWCGQRQIGPCNAAVADVVNFLSWMFDVGYEHSTINGHRSAISAYHPKIGGGGGGGGG